MFRKEELRAIATQDVEVLEEKGKFYGDSWKRRGGVGAFMMLARKWDRIENMCKEDGYDIFKTGQKTIQNRDGIMDDIADLRRYLLLVEEHLQAENLAAEGAAYTNQDR